MKIDKKIIYILALMPFLILLYFFIIEKTTVNIGKITGGCNQKYAFFIRDSDSKSRKLTFCEKSNKDTITLKSDWINAKDGHYIGFEFIIPDLKDKKLNIYLEDENNNRYTLNKKFHKTSQRWLELIVKKPNILGDKIRLIAEDNSTSKYGWFGVGELKSSLYSFKNRVYLITTTTTILFALLITGFFTFFRRKNSMLESYIKASLLLGILSLLSFFIYLFSVKVGSYFSIVALLFGYISLFVIKKETIYEAIFIFISIFSIIASIIFLSYSHFELLQNFQGISASTWHHFPVDNWIPKIFADAILDQHIPTPLVGDWLSSDRPPLQVGLYLLFSVVNHSNLLYLIVSMGAQLMTVLLVILLVKYILKENLYLFFISLLIFFNGFVFTQGLFVWPKLFSAFYQGVALYYIYIIYLKNNHKLYNYIIFGISSTLAFLAHGGSVFYLLALASILLIVSLKSKNNMKKLLISLVVSLLFYLPWILYQKLIDPPGDRLLKWHLANYHKVTDEPFLSIFIKYYQNLSLKEWLDIRLSHLNYIFNSIYTNITDIFKLPINKMHDKIFFSLDYSYLFFSMILIILYPLASKKMGVEVKKFIKLLFLSQLLYLLFWVTILASGTTIHQGAYFAWFNGFLLISIIVYYFNKNLFILLGLLNILLFIRLYILPIIFEKNIEASNISLLCMSIFISSIYLFNQKGENLES